MPRLMPAIRFDDETRAAAEDGCQRTESATETARPARPATARFRGPSESDSRPASGATARVATAHGARRTPIAAAEVPARNWP